ncbi:MAG: hypothetical protein E6Q67_12890 [Roseateles sp.]|nr:MAG: hypothetical protein E6Q67_12890 [Roseateles sp.]
MPTAATSNKPTLPRGIEIFRAGTRRADNGQEYTITAADLHASAAAYDPALSEAPLVVGHPASNKPAYGWAAGLEVVGDVLRIAEHKQVEPAFAEMVNAGRFKKRSASFYHPQDPSNPKPGIWYLRHAGFLGAQPPAVKGLKDIEFSEAASAVNFSDPVELQEQPMDEETKKKLDEAEAALARANAERDAALQRAASAEGQVASFSEQSRQARHAAHVSFAEGEVKAGRLLPKDQAAAVAVLDRLAEGEVVEFSEGDATKKVSPVEFVKGLISMGTAKVQFGEFKPGETAVGTGSAKGKSDAEIDQAARQYATQHKVSYAEALTAVVSFS